MAGSPQMVPEPIGDIWSGCQRLDLHGAHAWTDQNDEHHSCEGTVFARHRHDPVAVTRALQTRQLPPADNEDDRVECVRVLSSIGFNPGAIQSYFHTSPGVLARLIRVLERDNLRRVSKQR